MDNIILEITKGTPDIYEKIIVNRNGTAVIEQVKNGSVEKETYIIDFALDLEKDLLAAFDIMKLVYDNKKELNFKVSFNNYDFYSFDLYIDIKLMVKQQQIRKLSVYQRYEKEKKDLEHKFMLEKEAKILEKYEKEKNVIDISNVETKSNFCNERTIIKFDLKSKSSFELGESRFFADTIDISDNIIIPEFLEFVGQINLKELAKYDSKNLLPKEGMLYFFQSPFFLGDSYYENGKVIYSNDLNLNRKSIKTIGSEDNNCPNFCLSNISNVVENFNDRFYEEAGNLEYDSFKGEDINKIFGFYTDCQMSESDIVKISEKYVVLLQLGTDVYGEGVMTFLILEEDLKNKNFDNVIYKYTQS